jgi:hypothetical protein
LFSPQVFNKVPAGQVQDCLRRVFAAWGLPQQLGVDNGWPWGSWSDLPTALALWLAGLDVALHFLPVGQKQLNGVVERSQGTGQRWCEPQTATTAAQLQERLDEMDRIQREQYPSLPGGSRLLVYPQLQEVQRPYSPAWEEQHWQLSRAQQYLAGHTAVRRANKQGQVSLYARPYSVAAKNRGRTVLVHYDPGSEEWVFTDKQSGQQLRRYKAVEITRSRIMALQVSG